jgi:uncharacterized membrane protein YgcG
MARLRFWGVALLALALTGNAIQTGRTADDFKSIYASGRADGPTVNPDCSCVIYALSERGLDAEMGKWIADTVREVIEPDSWGNMTARLRYYAPKNILVVNNSSTVHTKIDRFLKEMKTTVAKKSETTATASKKQPRALVVPAAYRQIVAPPEPSAYPVPAPVKAPKHLFHFLIRYEGEGIIDDNVVKYMKLQNQGETKDKSENNASGSSGSSSLQGSSSGIGLSSGGGLSSSYSSAGSSGSPLPTTSSQSTNKRPPEKESKNADKKEKEEDKP